jgi:hypothetical protein
MKTTPSSTASLEPSTHAADFAATDKDFERMMQMLSGFWVTQIAGAVATYSIADHLAKGPATAEQISTIEGIDPAAALRLENIAAPQEASKREQVSSRHSHHCLLSILEC